MNPRERAAHGICQRLRQAGHEALLVGGCVRDLLLGIPPKDFDIATSAPPAEIERIFPRTAPVGAAFGVILVITPEGPFEVAQFRGDGPYSDGRRPDHVAPADPRADALRRDFTINALFLNPGTGAILDFTGGQEDLRERHLRTVGDPWKRFDEDKLRLFRAVRFAARFDFDIEPETWKALRALAPEINGVSPERLRDELLKLLSQGNAGRGMRLLDESGILREILPEIAAMKGVEQPPEFHPEGDVFVHTLLLLDQLDAPAPTLAMAALLHDVGKPPTQIVTDRIRFPNHDKTGARMAQDICRRLRFSRRETERIVWLVDQHMRLAHAPLMRESKRKRFLREPGFDELMTLGRIDCRASHGGEDHLDEIEAYRNALPPEKLAPEPLLTGNDLIAMGHVPGPKFSKILAAVEDRQLDGLLATPAEARDFVRRHWPPPAAPPSSPW